MALLFLLNTRVFELYKGKYRSLPELARAMEMSAGHIYRVKKGKCGIGQKFITGAIKLFPEYKLGKLFYFEQDGQKRTE